MKKFLLLIIIVLCAAFVYLKLQIIGDPNSDFNQTTRFSLGGYQIMRSILGLHSYGDARNWYLGGNKGLVVEVVRAKGTSLDENTLNNFVKDVEKYTGKQVTLFNTEEIPAGVLTDQDLANISGGYRHHILDGYSNLFIIYSADFKRQGEEVGKTFREYGIVLSDLRLREVTAQYPASMPQYVESTLLHEFGHQLGLEHNDKSACVMNVEVERPMALGLFNGSYTQTEFCDYELKQLDAIKAGSR